VRRKPSPGLVLAALGVVASVALAACSGAPSAEVGPDPAIDGGKVDATSPVDAASPASDGGGDGGSIADADAAPRPVIDAGSCPALTYPSGVTIQTFPAPAMTATYAHHLGEGEAAPTCFLDADDLVDPSTGQVYPLTVNVSTHFQLVELVGTEIDQGYGHFVLMKPAAVAALETFRESLAVPVDVISGFRGPKHQEDICDGLCGDPLGCDGTCANNSRHLFGDAFDLPLSFYTSADEHLACDDGFKFAFLESGTHLHVDQNPAYATCVIE
jgi:hypothetical protein